MDGSAFFGLRIENVPFTSLKRCSILIRPSPRPVAGELLFCPYFLRISLPAFDSAMSNLVIFFHFLATLARLLGPGGVRSELRSPSSTNS